MVAASIASHSERRDGEAAKSWTNRYMFRGKAREMGLIPSRTAMVRSTLITEGSTPSMRIARIFTRHERDMTSDVKS